MADNMNAYMSCVLIVAFLPLVHLTCCSASTRHSSKSWDMCTTASVDVSATYTESRVFEVLPPVHPAVQLTGPGSGSFSRFSHRGLNPFQPRLGLVTVLALDPLMPSCARSSQHCIVGATASVEVSHRCLERTSLD